MEFQKIKKEQTRTEAKKKLFLAIFSITLGSIARACKNARIHRDTYYDWRNKDPQFAAAVKTAGQESIQYFVAQAEGNQRQF